MTVATAEATLAATRTALTLTDAAFELAYSSVRVAIETAQNTGYYTTTVTLNLLDYNKVSLYLEELGYTLTTNRDGAASIDTRPVTISWLPKL